MMSRRAAADAVERAVERWLRHLGIPETLITADMVPYRLAEADSDVQRVIFARMLGEEAGIPDDARYRLLRGIETATVDALESVVWTYGKADAGRRKA